MRPDPLSKGRVELVHWLPVARPATRKLVGGQHVMQRIERTTPDVFTVTGGKSATPGIAHNASLVFQCQVVPARQPWS